MEGLNDTMVALQGVERVLEKSTVEEDRLWVVFLDGTGELDRPATTMATSRLAAERAVSSKLGVSKSHCYAIPAEVASQVVAVTTLEEHPRLGRRASEVPTGQTSAPAPRRAPRARGDAPVGEVGMRTLLPRQRELLRELDVDERSNRLVYSKEEHIQDWALLKKAVEMLGGVYRTSGRRTKGGWVFPEGVDAMDAIRLAIETGQILDPKLLGFYETSDALADALVARMKLRPGMRVLEPSAGKGALVRAILRVCPGVDVSCVELLHENHAELAAQGCHLIGEDFLRVDPAEIGRFDAIVTNPPFGKGRPEIHHARRMLGSFLLPRGQFAGIFPRSILFREDPLTVAFRSDLEGMGAVIEPNPDGSFRDVGTMCRTVSAWILEVS